MSFKKPLTINKKGKTKITGQKSTDAENDESASGHLASTDEANSAGDLPAADVGGKKDYTNYDQKYAQRYHDFNSMIQVLQSTHQCVLYESLTHELRKLGVPSVIESVKINYEPLSLFTFAIEVMTFFSLN